MDDGQLPANFQQPPLLEARQVSKSYARGRWNSSSRFRVAALESIDLVILPCSTLALAGRSGAGKSTLARCLARLEEPDSGEVWFQGKELLRLRSKELAGTRRNIQLVFQHSATAMNPLLTAADIVAEPLRIRGNDGREERRERALAMLERVGIPREWAARKPLEFSGGQRQRLAIARALILKPALLILDEALAGLDLSTQARIANLLLELQGSLSLSYLFISHDLRMAGYLADTLVVMERGRIVEAGGAGELFANPQHAETRRLVQSIPTVPKPLTIEADTAR